MCVPSNDTTVAIAELEIIVISRLIVIMGVKPVQLNYRTEIESTTSNGIDFLRRREKQLMVFDDPRISRIGSLEGQMDLNGIAVARDFAIVYGEFLRRAFGGFPRSHRARPCLRGCAMPADSGIPRRSCRAEIGLCRQRGRPGLPSPGHRRSMRRRDRLRLR